MAKPSIWGKKFNRDDDFVAQKKMLVNGVTVLPGQPIDKSKFTTRRLRCLYDWRMIRVVIEQVVSLGHVQLRESEIAKFDTIPVPKKRGRPKRAA